VSILDTPGHQDFSEDTYRTLAAADNAVMLIDAAKGLEPQTRKLFEVARLRRLPLFTFVNKLDRPARTPYDICGEIEAEFGITCCPVVWPIGSGDRFRGVIDRRSKKVMLFERGERGKEAVITNMMSVDDPALLDALGDVELYERLLEDVEHRQLRGVALLDFLHDEVASCTHSLRDALRVLVRHAQRVLRSQLAAWLLHGELLPGDGDFFIERAKPPAAHAQSAAAAAAGEAGAAAAAAANCRERSNASGASPGAGAAAARHRRPSLVPGG
jgi:translation elongation factor EF-G